MAKILLIVFLLASSCTTRPADNDVPLSKGSEDDLAIVPAKYLAKFRMAHRNEFAFWDRRYFQIGSNANRFSSIGRIAPGR